MSATTVFIVRLLDVVPELSKAYAEHLNDNGVLLPHVFMGEVSRFVVQSAQSAADVPLLLRMLDVLDSGLRSAEAEVNNLVAVSFIENLCGEDAAIATLLPFFGDATRRELKVICGV